MYQADNGTRLTTYDLGTHELKPILIKYLNVMYDCGYGMVYADKSCIKNYGTNNEKNSKIYKTYNKKSDIFLSRFDDGQFVLTDGALVLLENFGPPNTFISVDINGFGKKPNQLGKDLFMFQLDKKGELLPMGSAGTKFSVNEYCSDTSSDNMNGAGCTVKVLEEG